MWLELLQGPGHRAARHFTRARLFRVHEAEGRWRCQLANWGFEGELRAGIPWLAGQRWLRNGARVGAEGPLEPLDVALFDDGLAFRVHAQPAPDTAAALDWQRLEGDAVLVMGDAFLERGDAFGALLQHPTDALRAQWLALLLWPSSFGTLEASWSGAGLFSLELRLRSVSATDVARWLTRLPRRLRSARIGLPLTALVIRAASFQRWMTREILEGLAAGLADAPLEQLELFELYEAGRARTLDELLPAPTLARLRAGLPKLR